MSVKRLCLFGLESHSKELSDQYNLPFHISFFHPMHLSLPNHVHCLKSLECSQRRFEGEKAHLWFGQAFDEPMILLDEIVEIFYLP